MKALAIRQPWAWLILHAGKDIENRSWNTLFRGRVLIHASKGMTAHEYAVAAEFVAARGLSSMLPPIDSEALERGGIVGSVEVTGCVIESASPWFFGKYGFVLRDARPEAFVPKRGALGIFDVARAQARGATREKAK